MAPIICQSFAKLHEQANIYISTTLHPSSISMASIYPIQPCKEDFIVIIIPFVSSIEKCYNVECQYEYLLCIVLKRFIHIFHHNFRLWSMHKIKQNMPVNKLCNYIVSAFFVQTSLVIKMATNLLAIHFLYHHVGQQSGRKDKCPD